MTDTDRDRARAKRAAYEPAKRLLRPTGYDPEMKRPLSTVAGAVLVILRALVGVLWLGELFLNWNLVATQTAIAIDGVQTEEGTTAGLVIVASVIAAAMIAELVLAGFILRGHNWPRVIIMAFAVISIATAFAAWWADDLEITLKTSLISTSLDVLVLLALSSRSAAAYARRNEQRG